MSKFAFLNGETIIHKPTRINLLLQRPVINVSVPNGSHLVGRCRKIPILHGYDISWKDISEQKPEWTPAYNTHFHAGHILEPIEDTREEFRINDGDTLWRPYGTFSDDTGRHWIWMNLVPAEVEIPSARQLTIEMIEHMRQWENTPEGRAAAERERVYAENYRRERERN